MGQPLNHKLGGYMVLHVVCFLLFAQHEDDSKPSL